MSELEVQNVTLQISLENKLEEWVGVVLIYSKKKMNILLKYLCSSIVYVNANKL